MRCAAAFAALVILSSCGENNARSQPRSFPASERQSPQSPTEADRRQYRASASGPTRPPRVNHWSRYTTRSPIDDSRSVFLSVDAVRPAGLSFGREVTARLTVRCQENTTSVIVGFGDIFLGIDPLSVEYRLDDETASQGRWPVSTDHSAFGLWSGGQSIPLVRRMAEAERLRIRFTPYSESPATIEFNVSNLNEHLGDLRAACNW